MTFIEMIIVLLICATVLIVALLVLACLPNSPIRDMLFQLVGWLVAGSCGAYCLSPIDVLPEIILGPFGLPDDLVALFIGIASAIAAWQTGRDAKRRARQREAEMAEAPKRRPRTITVQSKPARLKACRKS